MASHRSPTDRILKASLCAMLLGSGCQSRGSLFKSSAREERDMARSRQELLDKVNAVKPQPLNGPVIAGTAAEHVRFGQNEVLAWYSDHQSKHLTEARIHFNEALRQSSREVKAQHGLAIVSDLEGRFEEAERNYLAALVQAPSDSDILGDLGYSYLLQGRLAESEQYCHRAIQANPGNRFAIEHLGDAYSRQGKTELARATYQRVMPLDQVDRSLAENSPQRSAESLASAVVEPNLIDKLIPGPSKGERMAQDLQSRMAELDKQKPVVPPSVVDGAFAGANGRAGRPQPTPQQLQQQLAAIDQEQYRNTANGAILIDAQTGQSQRIPGSGFQFNEPALGGSQIPSMRVEANAPVSHTAAMPPQQPPNYVPSGGAPAEYHQPQPMAQYLQTQRGQQPVMGYIGDEAPQRLQNAQMPPGYAQNAGQANPAAYSAPGMQDPRMQVQPALMQNPAGNEMIQPQPYQGASPYYEQTQYRGTPPYQPGMRMPVAQNGDPRAAAQLNGNPGMNPAPVNGPAGPGLNAALNAAGQPGGPGLNAPQRGGSQDAFQDASRAAARMGMGVGPSQLFNNPNNPNLNPNSPNLPGAPISQYPGQASMGVGGQPVPEPQRHLPTQLPPPDLSRAYVPNQQAIQPPAMSHGGQLPPTNQQMYSQDQFGTGSRYDEQTMTNSGVPQPLFSDPRMQQYEAQRWQAGQQFNHAVENIWSQGQVNSPSNPAAGSVYTRPLQMGQAPGYTPNVPQPYQNNFPGQWPGTVPNSVSNSPLSNTPQYQPQNPGVQPSAGYNGQNNGQNAQNAPPQYGASGYDSNVVVPQPYQPGNGGAAGNPAQPPVANGGPRGAVNYTASPYGPNGVQYQPGLPMIRPAPR